LDIDPRVRRAASESLTFFSASENSGIEVCKKVLQDENIFAGMVNLASAIHTAGGIMLNEVCSDIADYEVQAHVLEFVLRVLTPFKNPVERATSVFQGNLQIATEVMSIQSTTFLKDIRLFLNRLNRSTGLKSYSCH